MTQAAMAGEAKQLNLETVSYFSQKGPVGIHPSSELRRVNKNYGGIKQRSTECSQYWCYMGFRHKSKTVQRMLEGSSSLRGHKQKTISVYLISHDASTELF